MTAAERKNKNIILRKSETLQFRTVKTNGYPIGAIDKDAKIMLNPVPAIPQYLVKGYIETAVVKNLSTSYDHHTKDGISYKAIMRPVKRFDGHVFGHIFKNAQYQYFSTIKEQASFLITGLIIIEMALNIHGHLSYEMLRQILYKNYDLVIVIILGIFYTVKLTEVVTDLIMHREALKYENR